MAKAEEHRLMAGDGLNVPATEGEAARWLHAHLREIAASMPTHWRLTAGTFACADRLAEHYDVAQRARLVGLDGGGQHPRREGGA